MRAKNKKVMVIGGGIAGLTAAWELSRFPIDVELIEKTPFLGGYAIRYGCKATDQCLQCGACTVEAMLKNVVEEPKIKVHLATQVEKINRKKRISVHLKKSSYPPEPITGGVIRGYSKNNFPLHVIVDKKQCEQNPDAVPEGAVELGTMGFCGKIAVDAVILASGFHPFDAEKKGTYGYKQFSNVINGLDLEFLMREHGAAVKPSDGKTAEKIAFIQCVGSRDERLGNLWCSQVCCPYALRMAEKIKHLNPDAEITVFYMDIQNAGKDYSGFYKKCKTDFRFIRNIPVDVFPMGNGSLSMRYLNEADGLCMNEEFDLVVLSVGIMPGPDNRSLSDVFGLPLNEDGFFAGMDKLRSTSTLQDGIFLAGTVTGPKNIADSKAHAGQAAGEVIKYLGVSG